MRKLFSLFMALLATTSLWAYDFQSGDLYYNITSDTTVEVTYQIYLSCDNYENLKDVVIPEKVTHDNITYLVTSIGESTFRLACHSSSSQISSITIPNSVTSIGETAFYGCSSLTSITIPNSVTSIGNYAFNGCSSLTSMVVEEGNTTYDSRNNCNAIIETATNTLITGCQNTLIPNSVMSIGDWAFNECRSLTSITIPNSVTSIGWAAFRDCSSLTSITIPNSVTSIGEHAFQSCSSLTSITIPNSVTSIIGNPFSSCSSLVSMVVESGNTKYDSRDNCNAIIETATNTLIAGCQKTIIPNSVTSIGVYAFFHSELISITIPNSVTSIGVYAFGSCYRLTSITIPNSVTSIEDATFSNCYSLTSVTIGNSVTSIIGNPFSSCSSLVSMVVESGNTKYDSRDNCNAIIETATNTLITGCQNTLIPNSVTSIGKGAFRNCSSLTSITIPNSVTSIGKSAFGECWSLTSVTIPNSVTSIESYAFNGCFSLTSITIPNSVKSIGGLTFDRCTSLNSVICEAITPPTLNYDSFTSSPICYIPSGTLAAYQASAWASQVSKFVEQEAAAPTTITYELNGGVTNDYGWMSKADMFATFIAESGCPLTVTYDELKTQSDPITTIAGRLTADHVTTIMGMEKWDWLEKYIMDVQNPQVGEPAGGGTVPALTEGTADARWRYALAAFFVEGQRVSWPFSADFAIAGTVEAFQPTWKHGFANPTEPTAEWVLNAPYKEGATFNGWYATADFSGKKITTVNAETTGTLYAKWVEYIPTIAEVRALADDTETTVSGVVNHVDGKNIYIQDYTGGILVCANESATCKVGDKIVAKGVKVIYGGAPEVKNAFIIESAEAATLFDAAAFETLAPLVADSLEHKYFATNVRIHGVIIKSYDSKGNPVVTDNTYDVTCYKMVLDPTIFPIGTKVTVTAVAGWYNGFQFVGDAKDIVKPVAGVKENYTYPVRDGKYTLENNWVISNIEGNFVDNKPGSNDYVRGMAAKDGIMYFINRETKSIVRVDGKTGNMLDPIVLQGTDTLFRTQQEDGTWADRTIFPYNDIKFDQAGNCLIGACMTGATKCQTFYIYVVDLATGVCTKLIEDVLWDNPGLDQVQFRFESFGVAGDVTKDGVVMAADGNGSWNVYRWLITDGVAGEGEQVAVSLDPTVDQSLFINAAGYGTAPQIFPRDEVGSTFYVDGFNTLPMLFNESGRLQDDFINVPTGTKVWNDNDTIAMNANFNGLVEFQVGEEYFLLMVAANNIHNVPTTYALYKFADANRMFEGMEPLWYFPHNGLGTTTVGCRTAPVSVEVEGNTANIYLYTVNNGYASYTLTVGNDIPEEKITYKLNGGVTNDYGWMSKADMFQACMQVCGVTGLASLDELKADADPFTKICSKLTDVTGMMNDDKFEWLEQYIMTIQNGQTDDGAYALVEGTSSAGWRYALAAFFLESQRTSWPKSANFSHAGTPEAFMPVWKHGFANPTEPTAEFVLNAPYKEGATFGGWYATADFSGKKITIVNAETTGTLYAKWVEYIPTIAEVRALADDTETKVAGVVNHVDGKNIYIQDATGGILVYTTETPSCKVGDKIVAKGVKVIYGGAPEVKNAVIESVEVATLYAPKTFDGLSDLVGDVELKYFGINVIVPGLRIASYDEFNNPTLTDGVYSVPCKIEINPTVFPVGTNVTVTAIAGWYNGFQFVGAPADIVKTIAGKKEQYTYPTRGNGRYSLENNWIFSNMEDNYAANKPGRDDYVRGMAAKDGIMYFIDRDTKTIVRVDGKTGNMLEPIKLQGTDTLFKTQQEDGTWADGTTLPYNDIKFDQAGNCLIGACMTGATKCQTFYIYVVDLATGVCTKLIEDYLWDNSGLDQVQFRFYAFGCAGDVTKNGVVMAADGSGSWNVYRWLIEDGVAGEGEQIAVTLDPAVDQSLFINAAGYGTAPQIFPQDELGELFYVDGFNTLPMLFYGNPKEGAVLLDDFINVPTGVKVWNNADDTIAMNANFNGLVEFQVGEEHFLLMGATSNTEKVPTTYALYNFSDNHRDFSDLEPLWYFPHNGMGTMTNPSRVSMPTIEVDGNTAKLYIYSANNGYACYTLNIDDKIQIDTHTLIVNSNNDSMGNVAGSGTYKEGKHVELSAVANYGYHFAQWSDGNTDNPRIVQVTGDATYTAYFDKNTYTITMNYNSTEGTVSGASSSQYLDNITLTAEANYGYHFAQWSDGVTDNPRTFVLTQDTAFTAEFALNQYTITTQVNNSESGQVFGGGVANYGEYVELSAVANYGYHFAQWSDGNTDNPRIVQVTGDATYTAHFDKNTYTVTTYCNSEYGVVTPSTSGAYLDIITLEAISNIGYSFTQWSDGNTDNPRTLLLTQDTILMAEFTQAYSGKCGDDLYWAYDNSTQTLSISGMGDMYDYTATTQPWVLFKDQIMTVDIANTATSIGTSAFEGCRRIGTVNIGANIIEIGENAFAGCTRLYDIYCYPTYPPFAETSSFANYNVYLYVPCVNIREYEMDIVWGNFKYIKCMGAEGDEVEDGTVEVTPSTTSVTITWPTEENANTYIIEIKKDGVVFCRLTFNADGQLLSISFAPGRNGNHPAQYATKTTNGLRFTVTGLEEGTNYTYDVISKDENNESIETYSGEFRTQSNTPTDVDNINASTSNVQKLFRNGQLIIVRDGVEYNAMGQEM